MILNNKNYTEAAASKCTLIFFSTEGQGAIQKSVLGGMYKPRGQMRGEGGCSDDHNT